MKTERLGLKLFTEKDKGEFLNLFTDENVMKHVGDGVLTFEQAENLWRKLFEQRYAKNLKTIWAVCASVDSRFLGYASLRPRPSKSEQWEIVYVLKREEWGKGFATEIARRLIEFGFEQLNLPEIFATVDDDNFPSIRVLTKVGMNFLEFDYDEQGKYWVYSVKKQRR